MNDILHFLLNNHFEEYELTPLSAGATAAQLYKIVAQNKQTFILKVQKNTLLNDYKNYTWLKGKVPVPEVIFYECRDGWEYLCTTALEGKTLEDFRGEISDEALVKRYAQALKILHAVPIDTNAVVQNLDHRLQKAYFNLKTGNIDVEQLQPEYQHFSLEELYNRLITLKPTTSDCVFTHGDYCLDNLFYDGQILSGFIDLDKGGVADRYQDLALAVRTITDEFDPSLLPLFFETYSISPIDQSKMDFYVLLDEFF
ncbi:MAG: APH(3') family aminoglycoside O-phosphotransferase [Runella sp.]